MAFSLPSCRRMVQVLIADLVLEQNQLLRTAAIGVDVRKDRGRGVDESLRPTSTTSRRWASVLGRSRRRIGSVAKAFVHGKTFVPRKLLI